MKHDEAIKKKKRKMSFKFTVYILTVKVVVNSRQSMTSKRGENT